MNFINISVEPAAMQFNGVGRPIWHQCQAVNSIAASYGHYGNWYSRCGADASHLVTRTSVISGNTYTDHMCARHAEPWIQACAEVAK